MDLQTRARETVSRRWRPNTWKGKKTAANAWHRWCQQRTPQQLDEVLPLERQLSEALVGEFLEYTSCVVDGKSDHKCGLPGTVATYAISALDLMRRLEPALDTAYLATVVNTWKKGRYQTMTHAFGIIKKFQKAGISRQLMKELFELSWTKACKGDKKLESMAKAAAQTAFQVMLRRSEYTSSGEKFWDTTQMTRASLVWYDELQQEIVPSLANLRKLLRTKKGYASLTPGTSKSDPTGREWHAHPSWLKLSDDPDRVVCAANYLLEYEIEYLLPDISDRKRTPLFADPGVGRNRGSKTRGQLMTQTFDNIIIDMICLVEAARGGKRARKQIRKDYSLHSFRIGGVNALRAAKVPREMRMILGRWKSSAIDTYSREDIVEFSGYLEAQDHDVESENTTLAKDMPQHEQAAEKTFAESFEVVTMEDVPLPKKVTEITVKEAETFYASLSRSSRVPHPLKGRKVELEFETTHNSGDWQPFKGDIIDVELNGNEPVKVKYEDGEIHYHSYETVVDNLIENE